MFFGGKPFLLLLRLLLLLRRRLLKQLDHPNVIKYISHFVEENDLYIVLVRVDPFCFVRSFISFLLDDR